MELESEDPRAPQENTPAQPEQTPAPAPANDAHAAAKLDLGSYLRQGWEVVTQDLLNMIVSWLIIAAILATVIGAFLLGPLVIAFLWMIRKRMNGEQVSLANLFDGFKQFERTFAAGLVVLLVWLIAVIIGIALIIFIPCLGYIAAPLVMLFASAFLYFYLPIVAFSDTPVIEAFSKSLKFTLKNIGYMLLLALVTGIIKNAGSIVCGVGLLFTVPLALVMSVAAYNEYYLPNAE